ncbi:MAG: phage integrase N-terminal SAM-like domain-containing protein [Bacillota bacterium]|nr:phage integrase N-terminal SAM-like domain-containing protein [Bacillota bacterium]
MNKGEAIEKFVRYMLITNKSVNTIETYERDVRLFLVAIEKEAVLDITKKEIEDYLDQIVAVGTKDSVVKKKYASLKAFFNFLMEQEIISCNPLSKGIRIPKNLHPTVIKLPKKDLGNRIEEILSNSLMNERDRLIICLVFSTKLSIVELANLPKASAENLPLNRSLPKKILKEIEKLLDNYLKTHQSDFLFLNGRQQPLTYKYIRQIVLPHLGVEAEQDKSFNFTIEEAN